MPEYRTPEELVELAKKIRQRVNENVQQELGRSEKIRQQAGETVRHASAAGDAPDGMPESAVPKADGAQIPPKASSDDDYWDLGKPKPRIYAKPEFRAHSLGVTDVTAPDPEPGPGERISASERIVKDETPRREFGSFDTLGQSGRTPGAGQRESSPGDAGRVGDTGRVIRTAGGYRSVPTSSYRRHTPPRGVPQQGGAPKNDSRPARPAGGREIRSYEPDGTLIRKITIRTWEADTEFYNRFLTDAARSRSVPWTGSPEPREPVPYTSFVPQYAHMNAAQLDFYRYVRESVGRGICPPCDFPYVLLLVYEILNLPDLIPPEEGIKLLATLWTGYRKSFPRLDGTLCEWLPDYCMIHAVPLPDALTPLLPEIVPKAQLKEFYLDRAASDPDGTALARCVIENSSDYDFRTARYYAANRDAYETHIPAAAAKALTAQRDAGTGLFSLDRAYRMTRDSYVGAVAATSVKRRIDLEFVSFTRRPDTRALVTAMVKYAENRLRAVLGIKAKLSADGVGEEDAWQIDAYFSPLLPTKEQLRRKKEDENMPPDYLKHYEAESSGFDPDAAAAIEAQSWANTSRLTGEDYGADTGETAVAEGELTGPDEPFGEPFEECFTDPSSAAEAPALSADLSAREEAAETDEADEADKTDEAAEENPGDGGAVSGAGLLGDALRAAIGGKFRAFCRDNGLYEGDAADRINAVFLERIGDIVLEPSEDGGFRFVEEYREDAEEWLN